MKKKNRQDIPSNDPQKSKNGTKDLWWKLAILFLGVALGYIIALIFTPGAVNNNLEPSIQEVREGGYQLVNPLLIANPSTEDTALENQIQQGISSDLSDPNVYSLSVYFQDLNTGLWAGINQSSTYNPASLLKVPYMIAYLKVAQDDPGFLNEEFPYQTEPEDGTSTEFDTLVPGEDYSVAQLLNAMIIQSDNGAKYTLLINSTPAQLNEIDDTFTALGIPTPDVENYTISDQQYARFFKILYNATYLDPQMSEMAMQMLASSTFTQGIVAGIPSGITVAHKFGQYTGAGDDSSEPNAWELGDCGVVYYPNRPYLLCVMTRGANLTQLSGIISSVSQIVYGEASSDYKN